MMSYEQYLLVVNIVIYKTLIVFTNTYLIVNTNTSMFLFLYYNIFLFEEHPVAETRKGVFAVIVLNMIICVVPCLYISANCNVC